MEFLIAFAATTALALALREPLRRWPAAFYLLATTVVAVYLAGVNALLPGTWWKPLIVLVQRCVVAFSLFALVMFIGVLPKGSRLNLWLRPVRAELSIVACILCVGHVCAYVAPYASRALAATLGAATLASFAVAIVLFVLLIILGVTSFEFVKRRVSGRVWKGIQCLAYPFFGLTWAHLMFMLAPAASKGGGQAILSVAVYSAMFAVYLALRLYRARKERQAGATVKS